MSEIKNRITLEDDFTSSILEIIESTREFQKQVQEAKARIDQLNRAKIHVENREAIERISETKKQINDIKKHVAIGIAAKDLASESIRKIKSETKALVSRPFIAVLKAKDQISNVIKSITDKIFSLKTLAAGIVLGGTAKMAFESTVGAATRLEQEKVAMKHFIAYNNKGKSDSEIQKMTNDYIFELRKNANETPYSTNDVLAVGRRAAVIATGDIKKSMELVQVAEDMAALNPEKSLMDSIEALADLKTGETERMKEFGFKIGADDIVKAAGKSKGKLSDLSDAEFADAYRNIVSNQVSPLFKGGSKELSDTTFGKWSTTTGNIESILSDTGSAFLPAINRILTPLNTGLEVFSQSKAFTKFQQDLTSFADGIGNKVTNFFEEIIKDPKKLDEYKNSFKQFIADVKAGWEVAKEFGKAVGTIGTALKPLFSMVAAHPKLFTDLFLGIGALKIGGSLFKGGLESYKNIKNILKEFPKLDTAIKNMVKGGGGGLKGVLKLPFTALKDGFKFGKDIAKWIPGIFSITGKNIASTFKGGQNVIKNFFGLFPKGAKGAISALNTFKSTFKGFSLIKPLQDAFKGFKNLGVMKELPKVLSSAFSPLKTVFSTLGGVIKTFAKGAISVLRPFFALIVANPVVAVIVGIIAIVILLYEAWKHNWGGIREKTHEVIEFIKSKVASVKETFENVKAKCSEFAESIKKYWQGLIDFFAHPIQGTINLVKTISGDSGGGSTGSYIDAKVGGKALGTSYFEGGWTWVGEHGPELMKLPTGTQIKDNYNSMKMAKQSMETFKPIKNYDFKPILNKKSEVSFKESKEVKKEEVKIIIPKLADNIVVREDADIDKIATALAKKLTTTAFNM